MGIETQDSNSKIEWMLHNPEISDQLLLEALLNHNYPGLYQFTLLVTNNSQMAEYAAGQALVQAVKIRHRYTGEISLQAWLYRLGYRAVPGPLLKHPPAGSPKKSAASNIQPDSQQIEPLLEVLNRVEKRHQLILILRHLYGLNLAEVAYVLGIREKRVHTRLEEVRRQCLTVLYPDSPRRLAHDGIEDLVSESLDGLLDDHGAFHSIARLEMHLDECGSCKAFSNRLFGLEKKIYQCVGQLWSVPQLSEAKLQALLPGISRQAERQSKRQSFSLSLRAFSLALILVAILAFVAVTTDIFAQTPPLEAGHDTPQVWKTPLVDPDSLDHWFPEAVSGSASSMQPGCNRADRFLYRETIPIQRAEPIGITKPAHSLHPLTEAWETEVY